jgi:hypothetical protein
MYTGDSLAAAVLCNTYTGDSLAAVVLCNGWSQLYM